MSSDDRDALIDRAGKLLVGLGPDTNADPGQIDNVLEKLATGSRDPAWRLPIGSSGVLTQVLDVLAWVVRTDRETTKVQALRLIGNACADTDENRARVVDGDHMTVLTRLVDDRDLVSYAIPCLHNICIDYEPAQLKAVDVGLDLVLVSWLSSKAAEKPHLVGIAAKTVSLLSTTDRGKEAADPSVPITLLRLAVDPLYPTESEPLDTEDFVTLITTATTYLTNERLLASTAQTSASSLPIILDALSAACTAHLCADIPDPDDASELVQARKSLIGLVADVTGHASYAPQDPDPTTPFLVALLAKHHSPLQEAACLALGNRACSDASSTSLVQSSQIHLPLIDLLVSDYPYVPGPDDALPSALLHASVGLLKNLAIPAANKPVLGAALLEPRPQPDGEAAIAVLPRLWDAADTQPQTQLALISLCRLLLVGTPSNAELLCRPLPNTGVHDLVAIFNRADPEPTKTEASRAALALCRLLYQPPSSSTPHPSETILSDTAWKSDSKSPLSAFHAAHPGLPTLLAHLTTQTRFPALRSEAWFVLALMSRNDDGADVVAATLTDTALDVVSSAVAVDASPESRVEDPNAAAAGIEGLEIEAPRPVDPKLAAGTARADRENVLVMLVELLRRNPVGLVGEARSRIEELVKAGGGVVVGEREA